MTLNNKTNCISPIKMDNNSIFNFECHPEIECFTNCCKGISITLTPYDVIQLKKRLELPSRDFLTIYTKPQLLEKTDLPMITLKLMNDENKACPFVREKIGCIIYEDRPTSCRYYPLGVASLQKNKDKNSEDFFFFINESHCKGFNNKKKWSISNWRENQKINNRDIINSQWIDIIVRKRSFPTNIKLTEYAKQMFFLISYDIDKFREFIFNSSFLKRYKTENSIQQKISDNDIELLKFGLSWLKNILFKNPNIKDKELNINKDIDK